MPDNPKIDNTQEEEMLHKAQEQLIAAFDKMPHEVPLLLFTSSNKNEPYVEATREMIRGIRQISPKISLLEFDLSHEMAAKYGVEVSPTILFDPDNYNIKWLGAPVGEEGRTFVEALIMLGYKRPGIGEEALKVLNQIKSPRHIKAFVSPSCPYCPQQAVNTLKAALEKPDLIKLEIIDIQANPEIADEYSAQSVPQVYANETLIAMGAQAEELFMLSLEKMEQQTVFIPDNDAKEIETDLVIIGGGPAGLTAGIYSARSGLSSIVVERGMLGGQVATTPVVENYPGLTQVGGKSLVDIMVSHALEYTKIFPGEEVIDIEPSHSNGDKIGDRIVVTTNRRRFITKAVLLATGAVHRRLGVPGESLFSGNGVSYCSTCDGPLFKGKKVLIAGGGDSAVTEALHLANIGVDVSLVHRRDSLRAQEHLVKNLQSNNVPVILNSEIKEIKGNNRVEEIELYNNKTGETDTMQADGLFVAIGYQPSVELAKKIGIELTPEGFIKRDEHHRTNIPGIYSAGDVEGGYKQIVTAAGQGAEAAISIFEDQMNPYWKKDKPG